MPHVLDKYLQTTRIRNTESRIGDIVKVASGYYVCTGNVRWAGRYRQITKTGKISTRSSELSNYWYVHRVEGVKVSHEHLDLMREGKDSWPFNEKKDSVFKKELIDIAWV